MKTRQSKRLLAALALLVTLAACGGGGGDSPPAATGNDREVPASAGQSSAAFVSYLGGLATKKDDTGDGLALDKFNAPSSETEEPIALGA